MKSTNRSDEVFAALPEQWMKAFRDMFLVNRELIDFWSKQWQSWLETALTMQGLDKEKSIETVARDLFAALREPQERMAKIDIHSPLPWEQSFSWLLARSGDQPARAAEKAKPAPAVAAKPAGAKAAPAKKPATTKARPAVKKPAAAPAKAAVKKAAPATGTKTAPSAKKPATKPAAKPATVKPATAKPATAKPATAKPAAAAKRATAGKTSPKR